MPSDPYTVATNIHTSTHIATKRNYDINEQAGYNPLLVTGHRKGWGQSAKLGKHSAIWGKLGTALQAYTLNPCTKFAANPTSRKVNT